LLLFEWIESTALAEWIRSSQIGWPLMLSLHSIGMGIMLGLIFVLCLRLLGLFQRIPVPALTNLFGIVWFAFAINIVGGTAIFTSRAVFFATSIPFILKMTAIVIAAVATRMLQHTLAAETMPGAIPAAAAPALRRWAWSLLALWTFAIVTGRLTAYV
jgi:hypothetical protein